MNIVEKRKSSPNWIDLQVVLTHFFSLCRHIDQNNHTKWKSSKPLTLTTVSKYNDLLSIILFCFPCLTSMLLCLSLHPPSLLVQRRKRAPRPTDGPASFVFPCLDNLLLLDCSCFICCGSFVGRCVARRN